MGFPLFKLIKTMRNTFLISTWEPSRLYIDHRRGLILHDTPQNNSPRPGEHLYITNNESIKDGDWYITLSNHLCQYRGKGLSDARKVVLTSDSNLISCGVQEVSSVFLEFIVGFGYCKEVPIKKDGLLYRIGFDSLVS